MQQYTVEEIRKNLKSNYKWQDAALMRLLEAQTDDEIESGESLHHNGVGFTAYDAGFLTSLAQQVQRGRRLSPKQRIYCERLLPKYAGQLWRINRGQVTTERGMLTPKFVS